MAKKSLAQAKIELDLNSEIYKAVLDKFPDAILNETFGYKYQIISNFSSKLVNAQYNKLDFDSNSRRITVIPYYELKLIHDDSEHIVKINSIPKSSRLVYTSRIFKVIKFSRLSFNLKNNDFTFTDDMLNACRVEIMKFIQSHNGYDLDKKHLEPRLKKLLLFT